jgi:hypothetical protein
MQRRIDVRQLGSAPTLLALPALLACATLFGSLE